MKHVFVSVVVLFRCSRWCDSSKKHGFCWSFLLMISIIFHRKLSALHPLPLPTTSFLAICVANYRTFFVRRIKKWWWHIFSVAFSVFFFLTESDMSQLNLWIYHKLFCLHIGFTKQLLCTLCRTISKLMKMCRHQVRLIFLLNIRKMLSHLLNHRPLYLGNYIKLLKLALTSTTQTYSNLIQCAKLRELCLKACYQDFAVTVVDLSFTNSSRYVQDWMLMRFKFLMVSITKCPHW